MDDLLIVINTCENYITHTVKNITDQIKELELENVIFVSGQEKTNEIVLSEGIKIYKVQYSGLHHTGAIYVSENYKEEFNKFKYFMFLPDTIKFGKNFKNNLLKYYNEYLKNTNLALIGLINPKYRPSMDMGILNINHINNIADYLSKIKTFDISKANLRKLKKTLIFDEDTILGSKSNTYLKGSGYCKIVSDEKKKYLCTSGHLSECRIKHNINQVYLSLLDLYKFQRNFSGTEVALILDY